MTQAKAISPNEESNNEMLGAEIIVKAIINEGVDVIFGYPGGAVLPIYDALFKQNQLRHILVRHEQAATHAAEGYARSTGKVGVVLVTSGPGATNAVTGLTDALLDSIPLICITGQVPTHLIGSDAFQEADTTSITRSCTKYNYLVRTIEELPKIMHEAFHIARTGRPGPIVIDIPKNIMNQLGNYTDKIETNRPSYPPVPAPDIIQIEEAVALMAQAERPIFYVGGGVINSGEKACKDLTELIHLTGFPCTNTLMGLGAFSGDDKQFVGMLGMHGSLEANMCMAECDVMINIGARFDDRVTGRLDAFSVNSKKIHVDIDPSSINKIIQVHIPIIGDAGAVIEQMLKLWKKKFPSPLGGGSGRGLTNSKQENAPLPTSSLAPLPTSPLLGEELPNLKNWWDKIETWRERKSFSYIQDKKIIKPQYVLDRLNKITKEHSTFITTDVGQHQMWAAQFITHDKPYHWLTSGGLGTMGYGVPAAVGVQIAHPEDLVICVTGEASVMMNIQELSTIVQYRLPVKILILNNHYMGMVRQWQEMFHGNRYSESYVDALPDFVKLAEAYGMHGLRCDKVENVDATIKEMIAIKGSVIVDMIVDQNENVYPMIPAGAAHYELLLSAADGKAKLNKNLV